MPIEVTEDHTQQQVQLFISGSDYIEWNATETYMLSNEEPVAFEVETKSKIRKEITFTDNSVTISVKDKYSGTFVISAQTSQGLIEKTVYIRTV